MKKVNHTIYTYLFIGVGVLNLLSCTKYDTPAAIERDILENGDSNVKRRVLWINMEGAVGQIVKNHIPTHINAMLPHSKYTFESLSDNRIQEDPDAEDATNWTTLLTGMNAATHRVMDDSYIPNLDVDPSNPEQKVNYYPNVITHITDSYPSAKTLCVTPYRNLNGNMLNNAYRTVTSTSDEESRDLVIASIKNEDMNFTLVSFTGLAEQGKSGGFSANNTAYIDALNTLDGYIGECLEAINGREGVENEDWLVVITSGHGGKADGSWLGASQEERNTMCIFYYQGYASVEMKGTTLYGVLFDQNNSARLADPDQIYSAGQGRSLSVEALMRFEQGPTGGFGGSGWQGMIRKRSWSFHRERTEVVFRMEQGEKGKNAIQKNFTTLTNSLWHSYQLGIHALTDSTKGYLMMYDGEIKVRETSNTAGYLEDKNDLQIGGTSIPTNYYITELRIWDKMLDDKTFEDLYSELNIPSTHSEYKHLVGYWKFTPDQLMNGNTFKNQVEGMPDLVFNTTPHIVEFANTLPSQRQSGNLIIENAMIVPQVLYWLNVGQISTMDGFSFIDNFNREEEWREIE
ncbi:alkaline phosphatase family protein [Sphingobacterium sp. FBM7-1]|uniref:alkaline phosphatase family protein n=1 Tax=Sphingobacterium sp. FBM7-1 TaxID=2886688 RepID=UPI001D109E3F|nr:alkaline phosphatase family protein [Sphingobacterium sp. FBM7-1]MCC2600282.1 hypothetical protein [Sphingobacterium sp. FBM7-1]